MGLCLEQQVGGQVVDGQVRPHTDDDVDEEVHSSPFWHNECAYFIPPAENEPQTL